MLRVEVDPCFPGSALVDGTTLSCPLVLSRILLCGQILHHLTGGLASATVPPVRLIALLQMTSITSIALAGFFLWTGGATGTPAWASQAPYPAPKAEAPVSVRLTGYNAVPEQTDGNPDVTASGARSNPAVIAARSRDLAGTLPFGTVIVLETPEKSNSCGFEVVDHLIGYRVIADAMHDRKRNQVDVMFDISDTVQIGVAGQPRKETNPAVALGVCDVSIRVVGKINIKDIPATQRELALLMSRKLAIR